MASDLKSLAHKDWPYAGTAHEWRGFVKDEQAEKPKVIHQNIPGWDYAVVYQKQNFGPDLS